MSKEFDVLRESLNKKVDYSKSRNVISHSQLTKYEDCARQWKLAYIDKEKRYQPSVYSILGTALHEAHQLHSTKALAYSDIQKYLYYELKRQKSDLSDQDYKKAKHWSLKILNNTDFAAPPTKNVELHNVERALHLPILDGYDVWFVGFIDEEWINQKGQILLSDMKFTHKGWTKWTRQDPLKVGQLQLYKWAYHKITGVPLKDIKIVYDIFQFEFHDWEFNDKHRRPFRPKDTNAACKIMWEQLEQMVVECFNPDGTYRTNREYDQQPFKKITCKWCDYNFETHNCDILTRLDPLK